MEAALTTLNDQVTLQPLALVAPPQWSPSVASGDTLFFTGWIERQGAFIGRVRNGDFVDGGVAAGSPFETTALAIAANHDTAAAFVMAGQSVSATTIDSQARASRWFLVTSGSGGGCTTSLGNVVPLSGGRFLGLWSLYCTGWPFQQSFGQTTAVAFSDSGPAETATIRPPIASAAPFAGGLLIAVSSTDFELFRFDADVKMVGTPMFVADRNAASVSIATDGANHAMIATGAGAYAVDLATKTVKKMVWPPFGQMETAWTGKEFVIVTSDLTIASFTADGTMIGEPFSIATPFRAHDVHIASGTAGTAIVYARSALDTGVGDVERIFLRMVDEAPPHPHAAGR